MKFRSQESTFDAAVVAVEPGDDAEVEQVRAVGPGGTCGLGTRVEDGRSTRRRVA